MKELEITRYLTEEEIKNIPVKKYSKGSTLISADEKKIMYIISGEAKSLRYEEGRRINFPIIFQRDAFIGSCTEYTFNNMEWDVVALTDIEVFSFSEIEMEKYIFNKPEIFKVFIKQLCGCIEIIYKGTYIQCRLGAKEHFAYLLNTIADKDVVTYKSYKEFSGVLGVSESMLYRITRELIGEGLIEKKGNKINILEREKLLDYYGEYLYSR